MSSGDGSAGWSGSPGDSLVGEGESAGESGKESSDATPGGGDEETSTVWSEELGAPFLSKLSPFGRLSGEVVFIVASRSGDGVEGSTGSASFAAAREMYFSLRREIAEWSGSNSSESRG